MVGMLILSVLVAANLAVRWGRRSGSSPPKADGLPLETASGLAVGGAAMSARPDPGATPKLQGKVEGPAGPSSLASEAWPGMRSAVGHFGMMAGHPAWQEVRQRLAALDRLVEEIPDILPDSMIASPFASPSRNLFAWVAPAPPPPGRTESVPLVPPPDPLPLSSPPVILGKVRQGGRTQLMIREGNRVFFVAEGDPASGSAYTLLAHGPDRALLLKADGAKIEIRPPASAEEDGLQRALLVLQGKHPEQMGFRLRPLASAAEKIQNHRNLSP